MTFKRNIGVLKSENLSNQNFTKINQCIQIMEFFLEVSPYSKVKFFEI